MFILTDVTSRVLKFEQKKEVFIHTDAITNIKFPDWLGKALFWKLLSKLHVMTVLLCQNRSRIKLKAIAKPKIGGQFVCQCL